MHFNVGKDNISILIILKIAYEYVKTTFIHWKNGYLKIGERH